MVRETPETIEGDWDRFYIEFPDVYDRFAVGSPLLVGKIDKLFGLWPQISPPTTGCTRPTPSRILR